MLDACYGDTTYRNNGGVPDDPAIILRKSIDLGVAYGMNHIEIYQLDALNLSGEVTYAHVALLAAEEGSKPNPPTGVQVLP
jgi:hypothetical protein